MAARRAAPPGRTLWRDCHSQIKSTVDLTQARVSSTVCESRARLQCGFRATQGTCSPEAKSCAIDHGGGNALARGCICYEIITPTTEDSYGYFSASCATIMLPVRGYDRTGGLVMRKYLTGSVALFMMAASNAAYGADMPVKALPGGVCDPYKNYSCLD